MWNRVRPKHHAAVPVEDPGSHQIKETQVSHMMASGFQVGVHVVVMEYDGVSWFKPNEAEWEGGRWGGLGEKSHASKDEWGHMIDLKALPFPPPPPPISLQPHT